MFSEDYRKNRLFSGLIMLIIGFIFLVAPYYAASTMVRSVGWVVLIGAILNLLSCFMGGFMGFNGPIVSTLLTLLAAIYLIRSPGSVVASINIIFGIVLLVSAGMSLIQCLQGSYKQPVTILLSGVGILFALSILANPFKLTNMIIRLIGVGLIYQGGIRFLFEKDGTFGGRR